MQVPKIGRPNGPRCEAAEVVSGPQAAALSVNPLYLTASGRLACSQVDFIKALDIYLGSQFNVRPGNGVPSDFDMGVGINFGRRALAVAITPTMLRMESVHGGALLDGAAIRDEFSPLILDLIDIWDISDLSPKKRTLNYAAMENFFS